MCRGKAGNLAEHHYNMRGLLGVFLKFVSMVLRKNGLHGIFTLDVHSIPSMEWLGAQGISYEEALGKFWVLDADGLITIKRPTTLNDTVKSFARKTQEDVEGESLVETVRRVRTII